MKKINYRQYYYNGDYYNKELLVPEECKMYEVGLVAVSHKVKDREETWAKTYDLKMLFFWEMYILTIWMIYSS